MRSVIALGAEYHTAYNGSMRGVGKIFLIALPIVVLGVGWWAYSSYFRLQPNSITQGVPFFPHSEVPPSDATQTLGNQAELPYKLEVFVEGLEVPWSLLFTSTNRALVTERPGKVRVIQGGKLQTEPIRVFSEVLSEAEEGLMGMALDPQYQKNRYLYICLAYEKNGQSFDKVVRMTDEGATLTNDTIIFDEIPAARFHAGCRLRFGPDGKLYVTTGDATTPSNAQDTKSLAGKVLRMNADGSIPSDNPMSGSPVYSYGHRNPQGLDWHPVSGLLVSTEHGPSGNDGPGGGDEVNIIKPGSNYGWPVVSHKESAPGMVDPILEFTPAIAPASGMFYRGDAIPALKHNYLFGMLRGQGINRVVFDAQDPERVVLSESLPGVEVGRVRDVVEGPDGFIYFTTSNRDGRGKVRSGDDKIYRLVPTQK